jgi:hypothetical protein
MSESHESHAFDVGGTLPFARAPGIKHRQVMWQSEHESKHEAMTSMVCRHAVLDSSAYLQRTASTTLAAWILILKGCWGSLLLSSLMCATFIEPAQQWHGGVW